MVKKAVKKKNSKSKLRKVTKSSSAKIKAKNKSAGKTLKYPQLLRKAGPVADPLARKHGMNRLYPDEDEEQGLTAKKTSLQRSEEMQSGETDEDLNTPEGREAQVEEDEVEPWEAGFAEGASDEGIHGKDALTGEPLMDVENVVETEIEGKNYRFANEKNAQRFLEKVKKRKK